MRNVVFVFLVAALAVGCNQGDDEISNKARVEGKATAEAELRAQLDAKDQLIEKARAEGKAAAQADVAEQNANLARRSEEMEADLRVRHRFFQAVRGVYEGTLKTEQGNFEVRISLIPSLPPYNVTRVRQLEEVSADLNSLYFNAQIVQWNSVDKLSAVGCRVEYVRPDMSNGEVNIASKDCPNVYFLRLAEVDAQGDESAQPAPAKVDANHSSALSLSIREGRTNRVKKIHGSVQPTTNASVYELTATRVSR